MDLDVEALWRESTVDEQREILRALFAKIIAAQDRLVFYIHGLEFPVEIPWQKRTPTRVKPDGGALSQVAGAGFEPATFGLGSRRPFVHGVLLSTTEFN
jgi:hypothetical protein